MLQHSSFAVLPGASDPHLLFLLQVPARQGGATPYLSYGEKKAVTTDLTELSDL